MSKKTPINNIWFVTREYGSLAGAGGVKDVAKQLAEALAANGKKVSVVLPCYGFMNPKKLGFKKTKISFLVDMNYVQEERREFVSIWHKKDTVDIYLVDSPRFSEKNGIYAYTFDEEQRNPLQRQGEGHYDYFAVNMLLQKASICLIIALDQKPDVIHCHDGHTALIPALIHEVEGFRHYFRNTGCVVTIHNAGVGYHQEVADLDFAQSISGLPASVISANLLDRKFDPFLAASPYAVMNTVSENYARELRETDNDILTGMLGHTFLQRGVTLEGVTNGINPGSYNLKKYKELGLPCSYMPGAVATKTSGKSKCRKALCQTLTSSKTIPGLRRTGTISYKPNQPLFTFIGRFSIQKGVDKILEALKKLLPIDPDFQILILGTGQKEIEDSLIGLARNKAYKGRVCVLRGFSSDVLANNIYAAGDFFLIPSRYEPCGLTDFIAQLFGNLPIVHHTGGLVKVIDGETGFAFHEHSGEALLKTMERALYTYRHSNNTIAQMQKQAISLIHKKYTWDKVMDCYLELYAKAQRSI